MTDMTRDLLMVGYMDGELDSLRMAHLRSVFSYEQLTIVRKECALDSEIVLHLSRNMLCPDSLWRRVRGRAIGMRHHFERLT